MVTEIQQIAHEAYLYLYPLVTMDVTRRLATSVPPGAKPGLGPANTFSHHREYPSGDFKDVVRPNYDTLYSIVFLDLNEPMVVSVPDAGDRYYMLPMLDMWTDVFAVVGTRTTGNEAGNYAVVPSGWESDLPDELTRIEAPTPLVWIVGRTQTNGPSDYATVNEFQDQLSVTPLSAWPGPAPAVEFQPDPSFDLETPPLEQIHSMNGAAFFSYAAELMATHPPHLADQPMVARLRRVGIDPGQPFDFGSLPDAVQDALNSAPGVMQQKMVEVIPTLNPVVNGWSIGTSGMGVYGTNYMYRAVITMVGLGANLVEDAVYPLLLHDSDGEKLVGERRYVLHFGANDLPAVNAFWSVTMYDEEGFPSPNDLDRYALGDRDPLEYNEDGSLDIYFGNEKPDEAPTSNWLPAPTGPIGVTMRLYSPQPRVLDRSWAPPPVLKL